MTFKFHVSQSVSCCWCFSLDVLVVDQQTGICRTTPQAGLKLKRVIYKKVVGQQTVDLQTDLLGQ